MKKENTLIFNEGQTSGKKQKETKTNKMNLPP